MAGVAALLYSRGIEVSGCDLYPTARTKWLEGMGIKFFAGHSPSHITKDITDIVLTPAVQTSNKEFVAAQNSGARIHYRGEVLAKLVSESDGIAVCGTHGKTTTSTFITSLFKKLGVAPSWCIGGESPQLESVAGIGEKGAPLVVEADESDGTLSLYHPSITVLTSVDFDHLEHFDSEEAYYDCYRKVLRQTSQTVIVCKDHPKACELANQNAKNVITFGFSDDADVAAKDWKCISVAGRHNILNALAAIAVALSRGFSKELIASKINEAIQFLPDRRFETVASRAGVKVVSDYAHHPVELGCAVSMARESGAKRLRVIFQPHRYSRTKALLEQFPQAFDEADEVTLVPVYPAFEEKIEGGDIADLYKAFRERGKTDVKLARSPYEAWRHYFLTLEEGDLILIAGAGDVVQIVSAVKEEVASNEFMAKREFCDLSQFSFFRTGGKTCGKVIDEPIDMDVDALILGMGSNTWISDCVTDVNVVKLSSRYSAAIPGAQAIAGREYLNFMKGIPGTLGGWVKMNAGAFGHSIGEFVDYVIADGKKLTAKECGFEYRHSDIKGLITEVVLKEGDFSPVPIPERKKFPPRTCGSVFKNPVGDSAGRLLEAAGAKELKVGGARVWENHANVIVAEEGCTSSDILALARLMKAGVYFRFGIELTPEIRFGVNAV